jgi:hypothetical protein
MYVTFLHMGGSLRSTAPCGSRLKNRKREGGKGKKKKKKSKEATGPCDQIEQEISCPIILNLL